MFSCLDRKGSNSFTLWTRAAPSAGCKPLARQPPPAGLPRDGLRSELRGAERVVASPHRSVMRFAIPEEARAKKKFECGEARRGERFGYCCESGWLPVLGAVTSTFTAWDGLESPQHPGAHTIYLGSTVG